MSTKLTREDSGYYTHPAGYSVEREINEEGGYVQWRLMYPNGDQSTCSTLGEARGYITAGLMD